MERPLWESMAEAEKYDSTYDKSLEIPYEREEAGMVEDLRAVAEYLMDIADEIEDGNLTEDDWCINKMGLDMEICRLRDIQNEMSKHYN